MHSWHSSELSKSATGDDAQQCRASAFCHTCQGDTVALLSLLTESLEEICINFRNYAASKLGLYYELEVMKQVFASFGAAKMLILQGISGTGKTSIPYAFGQFIQNPSVICSVQPSWRDRTELFGYYNDFTKKYTETDFLKTLYESPWYFSLAWGGRLEENRLWE